jgi:hypothetical protein
VTITADPARFARIWRGRTKKDKAEEYQRYWLENGLAPLEAKGAIGIHIMGAKL